MCCNLFFFFFLDVSVMLLKGDATELYNAGYRKSPFDENICPEKP